MTPFSWDDDRVIDFVNWYIGMHKIGVRFELENQTIVDSFKNGDDFRKWHREESSIDEDVSQLNKLIEGHLKEDDPLSLDDAQYQEAKGIFERSILSSRVSALRMVREAIGREVMKVSYILFSDETQFRCFDKGRTYARDVAFAIIDGICEHYEKRIEGGEQNPNSNTNTTQ